MIRCRVSGSFPPCSLRPISSLLVVSVVRPSPRPLPAPASHPLPPWTSGDSPSIRSPPSRTYIRASSSNTASDKLILVSGASSLATSPPVSVWEFPLPYGNPPFPGDSTRSLPFRLRRSVILRGQLVVALGQWGWCIPVLAPPSPPVRQVSVRSELPRGLLDSPVPPPPFLPSAPPSSPSPNPPVRAPPDKSLFGRYLLRSDRLPYRVLGSSPHSFRPPIRFMTPIPPSPPTTVRTPFSVARALPPSPPTSVRPPSPHLTSGPSLSPPALLSTLRANPRYSLLRSSATRPTTLVPHRPPPEPLIVGRTRPSVDSPGDVPELPPSDPRPPRLSRLPTRRTFQFRHPPRTVPVPGFYLRSSATGYPVLTIPLRPLRFRTPCCIPPSLRASEVPPPPSVDHEVGSCRVLAPSPLPTRSPLRVGGVRTRLRQLPSAPSVPTLRFRQPPITPPFPHVPGSSRNSFPPEVNSHILRSACQSSRAPPFLQLPPRPYPFPSISLRSPQLLLPPVPSFLGPATSGMLLGPLFLTSPSALVFLSSPTSDSPDPSTVPGVRPGPPSVRFTPSSGRSPGICFLSVAPTSLPSVLLPPSSDPGPDAVFSHSSPYRCPIDFPPSVPGPSPGCFSSPFHNSRPCPPE
ncbi:unnamed protein product [Dicrocoelium dendriticum]|nr:unnamed protein product [Dicrocoelium dendriticum]